MIAIKKDSVRNKGKKKIKKVKVVVIAQIYFRCNPPQGIPMSNSIILLGLLKVES